MLIKRIEFSPLFWFSAHNWCSFTHKGYDLSSVLFVFQNCAQLQRYPFCAFFLFFSNGPGVSTANGSSAMLLFSFHEVSVFRESRIVADGVWTEWKNRTDLPVIS